MFGTGSPPWVKCEKEVGREASIETFFSNLVSYPNSDLWRNDRGQVSFLPSGAWKERKELNEDTKRVSPLFSHLPQDNVHLQLSSLESKFFDIFFSVPLTFPPAFVILYWNIIALQCSGQFSSVAKLCLTLCDPMDCSMPGLPLHHQLLEFIQTYVLWIGDAIQPSRPLSSPSPPAFNLSQPQGLFQ